jgi:hypothetical protein
MIRCGYGIARIRFAAIQACFFEVPHGLPIRLHHCDLDGMVFAAPANAQSGGEASGI